MNKKDILGLLGDASAVSFFQVGESDGEVLGSFIEGGYCVEDLVFADFVFRVCDDHEAVFSGVGVIRKSEVKNLVCGVMFSKTGGGVFGKSACALAVEEVFDGAEGLADGSGLSIVRDLCGCVFGEFIGCCAHGVFKYEIRKVA